MAKDLKKYKVHIEFRIEAENKWMAEREAVMQLKTSARQWAVADETKVLSGSVFVDAKE